MNDICQFIPQKEHHSELSFFHFVYEAEIKHLKQPFKYRNYYMHVVFKGTATLKTDNKSYPLTKGDVFFTFPYQSFTMDADEDFTFMYISFNGDGAARLLYEHGVTTHNFLFGGLENINEKT